MDKKTEAIIARLNKEGIKYKLRESYVAEFLDSDSEKRGNEIIRGMQENITPEFSSQE